MITGKEGPFVDDYGFASTIIGKGRPIVDDYGFASTITGKGGQSLTIKDLRLPLQEKGANR